MDVEDTIRVIIVDDQELFTKGLAGLVGMEPDMEVIGQAQDGEQGVALCLEREPDVVLMDVSMPKMDGVSATRELSDQLPATKVIILTVHAEDAHAFQGVKAGARGYLLKNCSQEELTTAIRTVHAGNTIMAPGLARKMLATFEHIGPRGGNLAPALTDREFDVLRALAQGRSDKEIAREFGISGKTVRNYTSNIYKKLHVLDRTQAVIYAVREGLVDLNDLEYGTRRP